MTSVPVASCVNVWSMAIATFEPGDRSPSTRWEAMSLWARLRAINISLLAWPRTTTCYPACRSAKRFLRTCPAADELTQARMPVDGDQLVGIASLSDVAKPLPHREVGKPLDALSSD